MLSKEQIDSCLKLLHPDYLEINYDIKLYSSKTSYILSYLYKTYLCIPREGLKGFLYNIKTKCAWGTHGSIGDMHYIRLFEFNVRRCLHSAMHKKDKEEFKNWIAVICLFHEVRHAYQENTNKYKREFDNYITPDKRGYVAQLLEKDAFHFSQRMLDKHYGSIKKIINAEKDYTICARRFRFNSKNLLDVR